MGNYQVLFARRPYPCWKVNFFTQSGKPYICVPLSLETLYTLEKQLFQCKTQSQQQIYDLRSRTHPERRGTRRFGIFSNAKRNHNSKSMIGGLTQICLGELIPRDETIRNAL